MSAWGLAIHPKSRVVAVSSNLRQVTVFIPAITWKEGDVREVLQQTSYQEAPETYQQSPYYRTRNTRRILKLGVEGHNIPSVDFVSDHDGEATSVLAIDILGTYRIPLINLGQVYLLYHPICSDQITPIPLALNSPARRLDQANSGSRKCMDSWHLE
jgi:hypothetical protein